MSGFGTILSVTIYQHTMAVAVHEMISWRSTWVKLNLPKAFFSRDCNSLCLWILTVLSPAPQRNNKKKKRKVHSLFLIKVTLDIIPGTVCDPKLHVRRGRLLLSLTTMTFLKAFWLIMLIIAGSAVILYLLVILGISSNQRFL